MSRLTSDGDVTTAVLSPDGAYVAHVKDGASGSSLWVRQTTTASEVQIVPPADRDYLGVSYSPDGSYVYFVTYSDVVGSLYRVPALGGAASRLVDDVDSGVGVSRDGSRLAFVRKDIDVGVTHLIAVGSDGSDPRTLATSGPDTIFDGVTPSWSPDARAIAYTSYRPLPDVVVSFIYQGLLQNPTKGVGTNYVPVYSPDGTRLAFMSGRDGNPEIYVMNADGSNLRRLTNHPAGDGTPTWSPNGQQLAFVSDRAGTPQILVQIAPG